MAVTIQFTLPTSIIGGYTGSGSETITLNGVQEITINTKKSLIKITKPKSKNTRIANPSDIGDNMVIDLKRVEDTVLIKGWLEDDSTQTAWSKAWKLRAMCSSGGAITNLTIENIQWKLTTQQAFLENCTFSIKSDDTGVINTSLGDTGAARVEVSLSFYIGNER